MGFSLNIPIKPPVTYFVYLYEIGRFLYASCLCRQCSLVTAERLDNHADLWQENKQRLRGLSAKAVDVIEQELESGNLKAAVELLKIVGMSNGRIALVQAGKSIDDLLEIDAAKDVDVFMADWEKPATTNEAFQREFAYRPAFIKDRVKRLKAMAKVPEDKAEEAVVTEKDSDT